MAQKRDYLGGLIAYSDIIFAIIFAFYFFTALYGYRFFTHNGFEHIIHGDMDLLDGALVYISLIGFLLYLYFIPYALWRKSKKPWVSKLCCNGASYILTALVSFYLIVYWTGHFHELLLSDNFGISLFFGGFLLFTTIFVFDGAIEAYLTHPIIYEIEEEERMRKMEARRKAQQQKNVQQQKPQQHPQPKQSVQRGVRDRLKRLKELLDEGLISEEDYKRKKEEILRGL